MGSSTRTGLAGLAILVTAMLVGPTVGTTRATSLAAPAPGEIHTIAGNGSTGFSGDGGPGDQAALSQPVAVAVDQHGNRFIADENNGRVRRIASDGTITTFAGTGSTTSSGDGGPAAAAGVPFPVALAVGADGSVFVASGSRIRKVSTTGTITTVAGTGVFGSTGDSGPATAAQVAPTGLAAATDGTIYVSQATFATVRRISPTGTITTMVGTGAAGFGGDGGPATSAQLNQPRGLAVGPAGSLLIADADNGRVRRVDAGGTITTIAGNGLFPLNEDGVPAIDTPLGSPVAVAVDSSGRALVAEQFTRRVRRIGIDGRINTVVGNGADGDSGDGGPAIHASLKSPVAVAVTTSGTIDVVDMTAERVREVTASQPVVPSPPAWVTGVPYDGLVSLSVGRPVDDGGAPVTGYTVTAEPGGATCSIGDGFRPVCDVSGLTNGTPYTFTATATNEAGQSAPSAPSAPITPTTLHAGGFHAMAPTRILDTRNPPNGPRTPLTGHETRALKVTGGSTGVPAAGAIAVVMNVTVTDTTTPGFLSVYPTGTPKPVSSSLNWAPNRTVPNLVTVPVGAGGQVQLYNEVGSANVVVDVVGWFDDGNDPGAAYVTMPRIRLLDSRHPPSGPASPWAPHEIRSVTIASGDSSTPVPSEATAVVLNVTATDTTSYGLLTAFPAGSPKPTASNLNWERGQTVPNLVTVQIGAGGAIDLANDLGSANVIVDLVGYYVPGQGPRFHPLAPTRVLDSRNGTGGFTTPWAPQSARTLAVANTYGSGVPEVADAVVMNMTVTDTTSYGFLTVYGSGPGVPVGSNLNWAAGDTRANQVIVESGVNGVVDIYNDLGTTNVVADIVGFYS